MGILSTNQKIIKIGGGGTESSGAVHYDYVQQLTDIQKETARNNIGIKGYSAGNNIDITNNIISVTGDLGHTYSGIDPIVVDNLTDQIKLSDSFISGVSSISSKQDILTAGNYIDISDNIISVTGKDYSGVNHINVDNNDEEIGLDSIGNQVIDKVNSAQYKWDDTSYVVATNSAEWNERLEPYSAGANINITNNIISGRDWQPEINTKLDTTAFSDVSGTFLTAHQDISNKLDTTAFSTVSGTFLTAHQDIPSSGNWNSTYTTVYNNSAQWSQGGSEYTAGSNINITNKVISGRNWSPEINTKLNTTAFSTVSGSFLTAHQSLTASGNWNNTYNTVRTNSAQWGKDFSLTSRSATNLISGNNIETLNYCLKLQEGEIEFEYNEILADISAGGPYTIEIYPDLTPSVIGKTIVFDGWNQDTASQLTEDNWVVVEAGEERDPSHYWYSRIKAYRTITDVDTHVYIPYVGPTKVGYGRTYTPYRRHEIALVEDVSGKMDVSKLEFTSDNKISAYDGSAFAGNGGKVYSGLSPIVVDNENDTVGLSGTWSILPGSSINFVTDNVDKTVTVNFDNPVYNGTTTRFNTSFDSTFGLSGGDVSGSWHYKLGSSGPSNSLLPMDLNWNGTISSNFSFYLIADQVGYLISTPESTGTWRRQITYVPSGLSNLHICFKTLGESNNIFCNRIDYTIQKIDGPLGDNLFNVSSQYGDYGYELWGSTLGNPYSGIQTNQQG